MINKYTNVPGIVVADFHTPRDIFVFGSTMSAKHDQGDALEAVKYHGAVTGHPMGLVGSSYAIVTRDSEGRKVKFDELKQDTWFFIQCAMSHPNLTFNMTEIGAEEFGSGVMRNVFTRLPRNVNLPDTWAAEWVKVESEWLKKLGL